ncbi:MAG: IS21-like element ISMac3 family transposase [Rickettsia endosymbiont of Sergentomyia squamirostris]|uniref:IS21-like element ISMac3 family transposase n=1 Tax=Candidatus Tisiphia endosymbiont of Sergentomyia squamirostris TaxID=3113639 RepID=A0AAT9G6H9_9RICK
MFEVVIKLWKDGKSKKAISRAVNHDVKTVRKIIKLYEQQVTSGVSYKQRTSKLDNYHQTIQELIEQGLSNIRIFEELQPVGYIGSYSSLTLFTRTLKNDPKICVRFHSLPGEEAQVDFGDVGRLPNAQGKVTRGYIFNMRLCYSRLNYYEIVFDQKVETFIKCHINAFKYFKGVPRRVKIDNLKSAIIEASFYEPVYQNLYASLSAYYGFTIIPCRVRKPQEKGKVESGIKYIQNNFFAGRNFTEHQAMVIALRNWLDNYCNQRIHGTTKEKPAILFATKEATILQKLPEQDFMVGSVFLRKVHSDCHVTIEHNYYSVPYQYVGQVVEVEITGSLVKIYASNEQISVHTKIAGKGEFATVPSHYPKYKYFSNDSPEYLGKFEQNMQHIGENTAALFALIVKENPHSWYRIVSGILHLRKSFSDQIIELSCKRALHFSITQYTKIKSICQSGCYNLELPN